MRGAQTPSLFSRRAAEIAKPIRATAPQLAATPPHGYRRTPVPIGARRLSCLCGKNGLSPIPDQPGASKLAAYGLRTLPLFSFSAFPRVSISAVSSFPPRRTSGLLDF